MGYQLYWVRLCVVGEAGVTPKNHCPDSATTSGGVPVQAVHFPPELVAVQAGGVPVVFMVPLASRSAGSCSSRIAFGVTGFVPAAGALLPGSVGGNRPRANPSCSHSLVTGCQLPEASLYSTRSQPSIRSQDDEN